MTASGTLRGFAKITRDMTDKRQVEQLQVADKQKNEFLAMLAHELRNPLAPIRNGVELLKMSRTAEPEIQETTRMMERQVVHLVRLVDDLLDVSRIITGKIHLDKEPVDVSDVIDRAIEEVQPTIDARGHELMLIAAGTADHCRRRHGAARAGRQQPVIERGQIHRKAEPDLAFRRATTKMRC